MDCSLPGSSVHGISRARVLEWIALSLSTGSSQLRDQAHISCTGRQIPALAGRFFTDEPPGKLEPSQRPNKYWSQLDNALSCPKSEASSPTLHKRVSVHGCQTWQLRIYVRSSLSNTSIASLRSIPHVTSLPSWVERVRGFRVSICVMKPSKTSF